LDLSQPHNLQSGSYASFLNFINHKIKSLLLKRHLGKKIEREETGSHERVHEHMGTGGALSNQKGASNFIKKMSGMHY